MVMARSHCKNTLVSIYFIIYKILVLSVARVLTPHYSTTDDLWTNPDKTAEKPSWLQNEIDLFRNFRDTDADG